MSPVLIILIVVIKKIRTFPAKPSERIPFSQILSASHHGQLPARGFEPDERQHKMRLPSYKQFHPSLPEWSPCLQAGFESVLQALKIRLQTRGFFFVFLYSFQE